MSRLVGIVCLKIGKSIMNSMLRQVCCSRWGLLAIAFYLAGKLVYFPMIGHELRFGTFGDVVMGILLVSILGFEWRKWSSAR